MQFDLIQEIVGNSTMRQLLGLNYITGACVRAGVSLHGGTLDLCSV